MSFVLCMKCGVPFDTVCAKQVQCDKCLGGPLPTYEPPKVSKPEPKAVDDSWRFIPLDFPGLAQAFCEDAALRGINVVIGIEVEGKTTHLRVGHDRICERLAAGLLAIERSFVEDVAS